MTTCIYPGCSKAVFPGSQFCSRSHRDGYSTAGSNAGKTCKFPGCTKPVYPGSDFCTRTHRDTYPGGGGGGKTCKFPGCTKPVFPGSDFCTKSHRDNYSGGASNQGGGKTSGTCVYPGCTKRVFPNSSFCTKQHRDDAPNRGCEKCMWCKTKAKNVLMPSLFCSRTCGLQAEAAAPVLLQLEKTDKKYKSVENQFKQKWLHKAGTPNVKYIYVILNTKHYMSRYKSYRANLESKGHFKSKGLTEGNEQRRFHGTKRECTVGDNGNRTMCHSSTCPVCNIMRTSFAIFKTATRGWERFGNGVYTSATSSKSNDYTSNTRNQSSNKAMLLAKIAVGRTIKLYQDSPNLTAPPQGYDSVVGEPANANNPGTLNYDELIVYTEDAVIPAYLIIY